MQGFEWVVVVWQMGSRSNYSAEDDDEDDYDYGNVIPRQKKRSKDKEICTTVTFEKRQ